jgi:beta-glucanase (GH16 family)
MTLRPAVALLWILAVATCGGGSTPSEPEVPIDPPADTGTWTLVWQDEFDGTALDGTKWSVMYGDGCDLGICGWGNGELQWYQDRNLLVANGVLTITARREAVGGKAFTSARLRTAGKGDWKYARVEARARLPQGQGMWPAIWMLPTDEVYGGWAASGEIDIMELLGHEPATVHGTIHYGGAWPNNRSSGRPYTLSSGTFADDFHTFALEWEHGVIRWFVDGELYQTQTQWSTGGFQFPAPFDQRFHLLVNLAVGGSWPGEPDSTTVFPQQLVVDWIRVYQRQ